MGMAAAMLHWTPPQFWQSTPHEFFAAYEQAMSLLRLQASWMTQRAPDF